MKIYEMLHIDVGFITLRTFPHRKTPQYSMKKVPEVGIFVFIVLILN